MFIVIGLLVVPLAEAAGPPDLQASHRRGGTRLQPAQPSPDLFAKLSSVLTQQEINEGSYVGSEYCIACHSWGNVWKTTGHSHFIRRAMGQWSMVEDKGVVADYNGNGIDDFMDGLDFNQIDSAFDQYKPNAPILSYSAGSDTYWVTVGELKMPVWFTQATQRYIVKIPTNNGLGLSVGNYFAPVQWSNGAWAPNSASNWYDENDVPRWGSDVTRTDLAAIQGANYNLTCAGCHTTGIREINQRGSGEWEFKPYPATLFSADDPNYIDFDNDGIFDITNIGCESCHGPGSAHILGNGDPDEIIGSDDLDPQGFNDMCGRCHTRPKSVPNGTFDWPYDDANMVDWRPDGGVPLTDFMTDASVRWPDGKHGSITRPYHDFMESSKSTFVFHQVICSECHSPHSKRQEAQIRTSIEDGDLTIPTEVDNNTLCLACHATHGPFEDITPEQVAEYEENLDDIAKVVAAHTNHPYAPERMMGLSRCTECHMPKTFGFGAATGPSHTFEPIAPEKTLMYQEQGGMPNACAQSCHAYKVNSFGLGLDPNLNNKVWDEQFDRDLAETLEYWYGPGGMWWDTEHEESSTKRAIEEAAAPGEYFPPAGADEPSDY
jgi:hypothetical protein